MRGLRGHFSFWRGHAAASPRLLKYGCCGQGWSDSFRVSWAAASCLGTVCFWDLGNNLSSTRGGLVGREAEWIFLEVEVSEAFPLARLSHEFHPGRRMQAAGSRDCPSRTRLRLFRMSVWPVSLRDKDKPCLEPTAAPGTERTLFLNWSLVNGGSRSYHRLLRSAPFDLGHGLPGRSHSAFRTLPCFLSLQGQTLTTQRRTRPWPQTGTGRCRPTPPWW